MFEKIETLKKNRKMQGKPSTILQYFLGVSKIDRITSIVGLVVAVIIYLIILYPIIINVLF
jgi:hypothetical protein